nr:replication factor A protein 1-like [Ipomoea batatas]
MHSQYVSVKDISRMHRDRSIRVRLVRTYEVPEVRGGQASKSKELLFHDVEGSSIHANIVRDDVVKYRDVFCEGKLYSINNFLVVTNYLMYKTIEHPFLIKFNYRTEVKQIKSKGFPILMICLKSFQSLNDPTKVNENELYDVIGIIVEIYAPLDKIIAGKPSRLMDFLITDNEFQYLNDKYLILGEVRITSLYDDTKLHCNESFAEFLEFKSKLMSGQSPVRSINIATVLSQSLGIGDFTSGSKLVTSISDMLDQKENGDFYVPAEILGIEGSSDWSLSFHLN